MRRLLKVLAVLLPLAVFVWAALEMRAMMDRGQGLQPILWLLGGLAVLALVEGVLFKYWILPPIAHHLGERVYAGGDYSPAEDRLLVLAEQVRQHKSRELLAALEREVQAERRRARAWQELARAQQETFSDATAALETLRRGAEQVSGREDRAMLLCRAAYLAAHGLGDAARAQSLYREAARRYPRTAYGRFALTRAAEGIR